MLTIEQAREMRQGISLSGDRNQCGECGQLFNSTGAFDKHRTGTVGVHDGPGARRCMSVVEMRFYGMVKNPAGFWVKAEMTDEERARAKGILRAKIVSQQLHGGKTPAADSSPVLG
ncbi:hypothetical protein BG58_33165 [Caballeronia jiangsuensis]|nr:hypothetical protein BG58_33165 [Caballeronia jiangsuensis]